MEFKLAGKMLTIVAVDADNIRGDALSPEASDDDLSWSSVVGAVTAATVNLTGTGDSVVLDGDRPLSVVLHDLVRSGVGSSTLDENITRAEKRDGI